MKQRYTGLLCLGVAASFTVLPACKTTSGPEQQAVQFQPAPRVEVATRHELAPVDGRSVSELLREADRAFQLANEAQQRGDHDASVAHYSQMLQLLQAANLDPSIFYSVREDFGKVIDQSARSGKVYLNHQPRHVTNAGNLGGTGALHIPLPLPERVLEEIEEIQTKYPRSFQIGLDRSHRYVPWIKQQLREEGMPEELAYLAMVESQYNPKINSPAGAGGMWQFMRPTGQRFNLRIDNYVDERYNWQSATRAAISYLKALSHHFDGNWPLAIAAYNMGEYGLERAIASNGGERDIWRLIEEGPASVRIKTETKKFYPRFLATSIVASNPERYGFKNNPQPAEDIIRVPVNGVYALADLEKAMGLEPDTLVKMNPDLINEVTPPGGSYFVTVPPQHRELLLAALDTVPQVSPKAVQRNAAPDRPTLALGTHRVARGETIASIARKYKISHDALMQANNIKSSRSLRAGQSLKIPGTAPNTGTETVLASAASSRGPAGRPKSSTYTVQRGDTLSRIASRHKVRVSDLRQWNNLSARDHIHPGSKLVIHGGTGEGSIAGEPVVAAVERTHQVQPGEVASRIAQQYGVPVADLLAWNNKQGNDMLRVGEKLVIRGGKPAEETGKSGTEQTELQLAATTELMHEVKRGEFASKIAQQYGVPLQSLLSWNNLPSDPKLQVGQKLVIRGAQGASEGAAPAPAEPQDRLVLTAASSGDMLTYEVKPGDYPGKIASAHGVKVNDLLLWNKLDRTSTLKVGDKLIVKSTGTRAPAGPDAAPDAPAQTAAASTPPVSGKTYTVQPGDSPVKIAKAHGMNVDALLEANKLTRRSVLMVGQKLVVAGSGAASAANTRSATSHEPASVDKVTHKVASGETAGAIAGKYGVKTGDLLRWNNLQASSMLKIGQELVVHNPQKLQLAAAATGGPSVKPATHITHTVSGGQNPTTIARRYGVGVRDLYQWNGWSESHVLQVGDEVRILKP